ncbi:uncharacterized protein CC84DRAFT_1257823 [Paraphaeosphaeria sporulosa]|uniref:Invertebrate defensins family profile domain-containing protein n=1 Tax=Paraphaeosphaeria sporulosa TaxID=1460663 RepID=A0A177CQS0_9PLEO|nr:uncharacterized protein CC84DRAFT_1257823 [Paraphaeosphaeria sporulosa]OAG09107.1 hypothetical protein CC84DRAFT_1257823 [Paraphaeosphaeria sporulosa]
MKIVFTAVFALFATVMAAPSVENVGAAESLVEKRCLGAGAETSNFNDCCSGQGYADRGCACTRCL